MRILRLQWAPQSEEHIARHDVSWEEVEDVVFDGRPYIFHLVRRRYLALGQTLGGR